MSLLHISRKRARHGAPTTRATRGIAALLAAGLTAGLVTVAALPASAADSTATYTGGGFTAFANGAGADHWPVTVTVPPGTGELRSLSVTLLNPSQPEPPAMYFYLVSPRGTELLVGCGTSERTSDDTNSCEPLTPFYGVDPVGTWELYPYTLAPSSITWGGFALTLTTAGPDIRPSVTANPTAVSTQSGTAVTFTSAASGAPTPSVQWQVNRGSGFLDVDGATSPSYTVTPTYADSGSVYQAVYRNTAGTAVSGTAALTVSALAPTITAQPQNTTVSSGSPATFTSTSTGDPAPTTQWLRAEPGSLFFYDVDGATGPVLTLDTPTFADNGASYLASHRNIAGTTYSDLVMLTVNLLAPALTQNPADTSVASGDTLTLTAAATSEVPQTVQWQSAAPGGSFTDVVGATSPTYSFTARYAQNGYRYQALFTNPAGTTTTTAATLAVVADAPQVTTDPTDVTVTEGQAASFTAAASADPAATVQWQVSTDDGSTYADIAGALAATYTIPATHRSTHGSLYRAVFTNPAGDKASAPARLRVEFAPEITQAPTDAVASSDGEATFAALAVGRPAATVQWQLSLHGGPFVDIVGATSTTLDLTGLRFADSGNQVRAVFTNTVGSATTPAATVTVNATTPVVTTDIADQHVLPGTAVTFTAAASGDPAPSVQWRRSTDGGATFADVVGATSDTYTFTAAAGDDGNQYRAVYTNVAGPVSTHAATLSVRVAPVVTASPIDQNVTTGTRVTFNASATGRPAPTVQWQVSTDAGRTYTDIAGATTSSVSILADDTTTGRRYRAVFTNAAGQTLTRGATLTAVPAPAPTAPTSTPTPTPAATAAATPAPVATGTGTLATTGTNSALLALGAVLMIAAGAAAVIGRRRHTTS